MRLFHQGRWTELLQTAFRPPAGSDDTDDQHLRRNADGAITALTHGNLQKAAQRLTAGKLAPDSDDTTARLQKLLGHDVLAPPLPQPTQTANTLALDRTT
eukprot:11228369-Prorocentrum_lima.AAC.1